MGSKSSKDFGQPNGGSSGLNQFDFNCMDYNFNSGLVNNDFLSYQHNGMLQNGYQVYNAKMPAPQKLLHHGEKSSEKPTPDKKNLTKTNQNEPTKLVQERKSPLNRINDSRQPSDPRSTPTKKAVIPTKTTLMEELLECPICINFYDNPLVLPCQHTFCKKCIISICETETSLNSSYKISCPICREVHVLTGGVDGLTPNYTMKRLIELESMANEKEMSKEKAICFICQKISLLKVCKECSYMLCYDCLNDPNHEIIIEAKLNCTNKHAKAKTNFVTIVKSEPKYSHHQFHYGSRSNIYSDYNNVSNQKLKLTLLCHSATVEASRLNLSNDEDFNDEPSFAGPEEIYEDEHGKCSTFCRISISMSDRLITLKKIVEKKFGILCDDQIIVYKDKILKHELKTLQNYHLKQIAQIHIFDERDLKDNVYELDDEVYESHKSQSSSHSVDLSQSSQRGGGEKRMGEWERATKPRKEKSSVQRKIERSKESTNYKREKIEKKPEALFEQLSKQQTSKYASYSNQFQNIYAPQQEYKTYTMSKRSNPALNNNYYTTPRTRNNNLENMFEKNLNIYGYH